MRWYRRRWVWNRTGKKISIHSLFVVNFRGFNCTNSPEFLRERSRIGFKTSWTPVAADIRQRPCCAFETEPELLYSSGTLRMRSRMGFASVFRRFSVAASDVAPVTLPLYRQRSRSGLWWRFARFQTNGSCARRLRRAKTTVQGRDCYYRALREPQRGHPNQPNSEHLTRKWKMFSFFSLNLISSVKILPRKE